MNNLSLDEQLALSKTLFYIRKCSDAELDVVEHEVRLMHCRRDPASVLPPEVFDKVLTYSYVKELGKAAQVSRCVSTRHPHRAVPL